MNKLQAIVLLCSVWSFHESYARIPPEIGKLMPPELMELILSLRGICTRKVGLNAEDIEKFDITPDSPQAYKCYMECMMSAARWITPSGKINFDKMLNESYPDIKAIMEKAVNQCRKTPESPDNCETAFQFNLCIYNADPEHYFLP